MQIVPAYKTIVEAQYVEMMVPLYSYGCEKKIKKTLSNLKGKLITVLVLVFKSYVANLKYIQPSLLGRTFLSIPKSELSSIFSQFNLDR